MHDEASLSDCISIENVLNRWVLVSLDVLLMGDLCMSVNLHNVIDEMWSLTFSLYGYLLVQWSFIILTNILACKTLCSVHESFSNIHLFLSTLEESVILTSSEELFSEHLLSDIYIIISHGKNITYWPDFILI